MLAVAMDAEAVEEERAVAERVEKASAKAATTEISARRGRRRGEIASEIMQRCPSPSSAASLPRRVSRVLIGRAST